MVPSRTGIDGCEDGKSKAKKFCAIKVKSTGRGHKRAVRKMQRERDEPIPSPPPPPKKGNQSHENVRFGY